MRLKLYATPVLETTLRTIAFLALLGLLVLALMPMQEGVKHARADQLQWQSSWD